VEVLPAVDTSDWSTETVDVHVAEVRAIFAEHLGEEE
jgi:putative phosphoserine phosphatase/1-acylglycerol-3-phosphate O-acyltransferase